MRGKPFEQLPCASSGSLRFACGRIRMTRSVRNAILRVFDGEGNGSPSPVLRRIACDPVNPSASQAQASASDVRT
jgi:hypothetical protein